MIIAGALGIAIGFLITSNLPQSDDPAPSTDVVVDESRATTGFSAPDAASRRLLRECRSLASEQVRVALAADTSLDQWRLHIQAMNQLVAGRISLDQATRYWQRTGVGAKRNAGTFMLQHHMLHNRNLGCAAPATLSETSTRLRQRVEHCQRTIDALEELLGPARTAVMTWMHHIHDMNALLAGKISPAQATAMWVKKWQIGARQRAQIGRYGSVVAAFPERLLGLRSSRVRTRLCRKWAVAPSLRMTDVQHAGGGSGSNDHDRCQIESKAE
jgi:hypothetical protein